MRKPCNLSKGKIGLFIEQHLKTLNIPMFFVNLQEGIIVCIIFQNYLVKENLFAAHLLQIGCMSKVSTCSKKENDSL